MSALRVINRNELEISTAMERRFLGVGTDEPVEVVAFVRGRPWVGYAHTESEQIALAKRAQAVRGYAGCYLLVNSIPPEIADRYPQGNFGPAHNGRTSDKEITQRRALYIDVDPLRPKGSATDTQLRETYAIAAELEAYLSRRVGPRSIGHGCSGNGYFVLVALEPLPTPAEQNGRVRRLLTLLDKKFGTDTVKIDASVFNPARLMPYPGTLKAKGANTDDRPHRMTSFVCRAQVERVPLEVLCGA